jgi:5-methylcytosine-specific restriction endonuclease McrA
MDINRSPQVVKRLRTRSDGLVSPLARQIAVQIAEGIPFTYPELHGWKPSKPRKHKACPKSIRRRVRAAFNCCEYCGCASGAAVDRIVPRLHGGTYDPANVTRACLVCNSNKGTSEFIGPVRSLSVMEARHA